jgi:DNA-binding CsgD family transcriptional regulator
VTVICRDALAAGRIPGPAADSLGAELFANASINAATIGEALERAQDRLASPGTSSAWRVNGAMIAAAAAQPPGDALDLLAPVLASGLRDIPPDSLSAVYALLVLIWSEELATASDICDAVLSAARGRGSMSMVAHASCLHSMIMRRLGRLDDAAADAALALEFKLATSPPLAVAWAARVVHQAAHLAWARFGQKLTPSPRPPPTVSHPGWIHTLTFLQARGALRVAQRRHAEALEDLLAAGTAGCARARRRQSRRRVTAHRRGRRAHRARPSAGGAELAAEQLMLARQVGTPATLGAALRAHAAAVDAGHSGHPGRSGRSGQSASGEPLAEAVSLLEATPARYELALALADLGAHLRRSGRRADARDPLRRALDLAQRTGAAPLAERARRELLAAGARPRRTALTGPDALTSAERRVASLAADGLSNRQIAQHLFITQPTVETHLRHAFQKLGITSRADLPAQLAGEQPMLAGLPG